jgi:Aldehyde ferredoxin oxidoreductase, domains 2 & 3.
MDRTCDEVGMDTIEMANTMAMAMEGGVAWGDSKAVIAELAKVGTSDPLGRIYGNGTSFTAKAFRRGPGARGQEPGSARL